MRVLMITDTLAPDGLDATAHQARRLYEQGRLVGDVHLVAGYRRSRGYLPAEALGVDLCGASDLSSRWAMRRAAQRRARQLKPDVVLTTRPSLPRCKRPAVLYLASPSIDPRLPGLPRLARLSAFRRVLLPSDAAARSFEALGVSPELIRVVPPAIPSPSLRDSGSSPTLSLLCLGGLAPHRGQHLAIDAIARLSPVEKARVHLHIVGRAADPVYVEHLKVQAYEQPISLHIDEADSGRFIAQADLMLAPSLVDVACPYPALEAVVAGVPLAYADRPTATAMVGDLGHRVVSGDANAWRDVVRAFIDQPAAFWRTAEAGVEQARAQWSASVSWTAVHRQLQDIL
ncbi:MAG: glycosyltransferase [Myxococcota bacterium]